MCGITGFVDFNKNSGKDNIDSMTQSLIHRGPDDYGTLLVEDDNYTIGLGQTRLSIIGIGPTGHQPMESSCKQYTIVFNGEIYNYKELKEGLRKSGVKFRTTSDTEVLLELYKLHGVSCIGRLTGMFAFAILDLVEKRVLLARDRMGVKPLYYCYRESIFMFGSELKSLTKHFGFSKDLDPESLSEYFKYGYISEPKTIYKEGSKLKKGEYIQLDFDNGSISSNCYWDVKSYFREPRTLLSYSEIEDHLMRHLTKAINYRMVSDVPVGVFLSGGYDSALTCAILKNELNADFETFTLGFEESSYDESTQASAIANHLKLRNNHCVCTEADALSITDVLPDVFDEPFADPSAIPTLLLSEFTSSHVKVALSGDGGDEAFAGYLRYMSYQKTIEKFSKFEKIAPVNFSKITRAIINPKAKALLGFLNGSSLNYLINASEHISNKTLNSLLLNHRRSLYKYDFEGIDPKDQMLVWDYERYLSNDVLVKVDRSSMYYGLESREPLLDHQLIEFAATIPFEFKIQDGVPKFPLRNITHKYIDEGLINKPKRGFSPPLKQWLDGPFKKEYQELTSHAHLKNQKVFNPESLHKIVNGITPEYLQYRLKWSIYVFQKWHEHWFR